MTEEFEEINKIGLLNKVKSVLRFHQALGIDTLPKNTAVDAFLRIEADQVSLPKMAGTEAFCGSSQERELLSGDEVLEISLNLKDISAEVASCDACELHKQRLYPVSGRGEKNVRLMIIGDWLSQESDGSLPPGHIFGVQQDLMLGKMLTAINLLPTEVYITNVIKCAIPSSIQPQASHVQSCLSFLRRQIVLLDPEIICTMGMIAARAVLNQSQSLSQSRGRFHEYDIGNGRHIPVLTTYHPTYLLRNSEMKTATWSDLQFLARKMGLQTVAATR